MNHMIQHDTAAHSGVGHMLVIGCMAVRSLTAHAVLSSDEQSLFCRRGMFHVERKPCMGDRGRGDIGGHKHGDTGDPLHH